MLLNNLRNRITEDLVDYEKWINRTKSQIETLIKEREDEINKICESDYSDDVRLAIIDRTCNDYDSDIDDLEYQLHYNQFRALIDEMAISWLDEHEDFAEKVSESGIEF